MSWLISKIIKEIFRQMTADDVLFTIIKNKLIDFVEERVMDSERETDDKIILPLLETLKVSDSANFSVDLMSALIDALGRGSKIATMLMIDHIEERILGSRSKLDDKLFLPPINLLKKLL